MAVPDLLDPDPALEGMGACDDDRRRAYARYLAAGPDDAEEELIRSAVQRNRLTGDGRFIEEIERRTGLRLENRGRG